MDADYATHLATHVARSTAATAALIARDGPKKPWIGFNYTEQDAELHQAERASIPATFAISGIFPALAIVAVVLRFVAAGRSKAGRTADDWLVFAALFPTVGSCVWMIATYVVDRERIVKSFFKEAEKGNFTELDDPLGNNDALQWGPAVVTIFYLTALALTKLSVLLLYRRLFDVRIMHLLVRGGVVLVCATWVTFLVPSLLGLAGRLSNGVIFDFILSFACIDLVTDVAILSLPVPFILRLHMSAARRLQVAGMFGLAAFCVVSSIVRLAFLVDYWTKLQFVFAHELDWYASFTLAQFARSWWMSWIWALIEPCTSVIAACLPTLHPLVDGIGDRLPRLAAVFSRLRPGRSSASRSSSSSSFASPKPTGRRVLTAGSNGSVSSADSVELAKMANASKAKPSITVHRPASGEGGMRSPGAESFGSPTQLVAPQRPEWNRSSRNLANTLAPGRLGIRTAYAQDPLPESWRRSGLSGMSVDPRDLMPDPLRPAHKAREWV